MIFYYIFQGERYHFELTLFNKPEKLELVQQCANSDLIPQTYNLKFLTSKQEFLEITPPPAPLNHTCQPQLEISEKQFQIPSYCFPSNLQVFKKYIYNVKVYNYISIYKYKESIEKRV